MFKLTTKIDLRGIEKKVIGNEKAQAYLDQQVLKDSNEFVPMDTGALRDSSISASEIGKGRLTWDTPYARKLYWNPQYNFSKDVNPNARGLWFEAAKSVYLSDWINAAKKGF